MVCTAIERKEKCCQNRTDLRQEHYKNLSWCEKYENINFFLLKIWVKLGKPRSDILAKWLCFFGRGAAANWWTGIFETRMHKWNAAVSHEASIAIEKSRCNFTHKLQVQIQIGVFFPPPRWTWELLDSGFGAKYVPDPQPDLIGYYLEMFCTHKPLRPRT